VIEEFFEWRKLGSLSGKLLIAMVERLHEIAVELRSKLRD
jgi:hypothetical protein